MAFENRASRNGGHFLSAALGIRGPSNPSQPGVGTAGRGRTPSDPHPNNFVTGSIQAYERARDPHEVEQRDAHQQRVDRALPRPRRRARLHCPSASVKTAMRSSSASPAAQRSRWSPPSGMSMADLMPASNIVAIYDYRDEHGSLLFQDVRLSPKGFRLRRRNAKGEWVWKMDGVRRVPYRLPELQGQRLALLVEGERDADGLAALGLIATTTPMGAGGWRDEYVPVFKDSGVEKVVVIPDNDEPGRRYAVQAGTALTAIGITVRVLELLGVPEKGDVSDWLDAGGTADELKALLEQAPTFDAWRGTDAVRPVIDTRDGDWRRIVEEAYNALVQRNGRNGGPSVFVGPENLVQVRTARERPPQRDPGRDRRYAAWLFDEERDVSCRQ